MDFGDAGYIEGRQNGDDMSFKAKVHPIDTTVEGRMRGGDTEIDAELPMDIRANGKMEEGKTEVNVKGLPNGIEVYGGMKDGDAFGGVEMNDD